MVCLAHTLLLGGCTLNSTRGAAAKPTSSRFSAPMLATKRPMGSHATP